LGVVKPAILLTTREQIVQCFIDDIGMQNGEIRVKVQNGKVVLMEVESRIRNNFEEMGTLEKMQF